MAIIVEFIEPLKKATGTAMVELDSSYNTFEKVMLELLRLYPKLENEMFDDGLIHFTCYILLNGKHLAWPGDKDKVLRDGDNLIFMAFLAGG
ncbi:MAG: MoaD/ThiS family protein [Clostridia bacterium]|nr:MoaD/ThiS family protein [Clostridia bacterium]